MSALFLFLTNGLFFSLSPSTLHEEKVKEQPISLIKQIVPEQLEVQEEECLDDSFEITVRYQLNEQNQAEVIGVSSDYPHLESIIMEKVLSPGFNLPVCAPQQGQNEYSIMIKLHYYELFAS